MAYMSQERKKELEPAIKAALKKHGLKGSLSVYHHSELVLTITEGWMDFHANHNAVMERSPRRDQYWRPVAADEKLGTNHYHLDNQFDGEILAVLEELKGLMDIGNHNRSDISTDYHDVGWYLEIRIGKWDKPYKLNPAMKPKAPPPPPEDVAKAGAMLGELSVAMTESQKAAAEGRLQ